jgi:S-adenosyl methyltransferase
MSNSMSGYRPDLSKPSVARVHDALLGGRDNFAPDRELAARLTEICPALPALAREDRAFLIRAVTWAAGRASASSPTSEPACPAAKVVYVDNDPGAVSHVRVLLTAGDETDAVDADLADPAAVTRHPAFRGVIDPAGPVCLVFGLVLNLFPAEKAREVIAGYADLVAPGSCIVISCGRVDDPELWERLSGAFTAAAVCNHTRGEVAGLDLVNPGLVPARN